MHRIFRRQGVPTQMDAVPTAESVPEVERYFRRNVLANFMDLAWFWLGNSFVSATTILPLYVARAGGDAMLVGLVSAIGVAGWYLPQLIAANYVERGSRRKPFVVLGAFFLERLPVIILAASAFLIDPHNPWLLLTVFFMAYTWHSLGAGIVGTAWQDLLARTIPTERRGRFFGTASFAGSAMGAAGAALSVLILDRFPFPTGFAWCFTIAAAAMLVSWLFLLLLKEPSGGLAKPPVSLATYLKGLPDHLRRDRNFGRFLVNRAVNGLGRMATGFVAVYAVARWNLPDSSAGSFTVAMLLAQTVAYLLLGFLADRKGHKTVLEIGGLVAVLTFALCGLAPTSGWIYLVFAGLGIRAATDVLSGLMIVLEFTGTRDRPTYVGLANTTTGVFTAVAPILGGWLATQFGYPILFAVAAVVSALAFGLLRWRVDEPRTAQQ